MVHFKLAPIGFFSKTKNGFNLIKSKIDTPIISVIQLALATIDADAIGNESMSIVRSFLHWIISASFSNASQTSVTLLQQPQNPASELA